MATADIIRQKKLEKLPPFKRQRLHFIDFHLYWYGTITKPAVIDQFKVDRSTALVDFRTYRDLGGRMELRKQQYSVPSDFRPIIITPDAEDFLYSLGRTQGVAAPYSYVARASDADATDQKRGDIRKSFTIDGPVELERQRIRPGVLRRIIQAVRGERDLKIVYKSPNRPGTSKLWITPHALSNDAFRWAARAYRLDYGRYGDVVLDRIVDALEERPATHLGLGDRDWNEFVDVRLGPHPGLGADARWHIEKQYGMRNGELRLRIRRAMLLYFLKRYQIEEQSTRKAPHQQPLVILNRAETTAALPPWKRIPPEEEDEES